MENIPPVIELYRIYTTGRGPKLVHATYAPVLEKFSNNILIPFIAWERVQPVGYWERRAPMPNYLRNSTAVEKMKIAATPEQAWELYTDSLEKELQHQTWKQERLTEQIAVANRDRNKKTRQTKEEKILFRRYPPFSAQTLAVEGKK